MSVFDYLDDFCKYSPIVRAIYDDVNEFQNIVSHFAKCEQVLIIGTGGSSLGGKCLANFHSALTGTTARVIYLENIDAIHFLNKTKNFNPSNTGIVIISKSGCTAEILTLLSALQARWPRFDFANRALAITEASNSSLLFRVANDLKMRTYAHHPDIGGRFSVFSATGLIPAILNGADIQSFLTGAQQTAETKLAEIALSAEKMAKLYKTSQITQHILITYSDLFQDLGEWFIQLQSESLGKSCHYGWTPMHLRGTIYQHSILQLLLAGPQRSYYTLLRITPTEFSISEANIVGEMQSLMKANEAAAIEIIGEKAPLRVLDCAPVSLMELGKIMMRLILETVGIAHELSIDAFDQPAVEEIKRRVAARKK